MSVTAMLVASGMFVSVVLGSTPNPSPTPAPPSAVGTLTCPPVQAPSDETQRQKMIAALNEQLKTLKVQVAALTQQRSTQQALLDALQTQKTSAEASLAALPPDAPASRRSALQQQVTNLQTQMDAAGAAIVSLDKLIASGNQQMVCLNSQIAQLSRLVPRP